jgi:hypothetical protein
MLFSFGQSQHERIAVELLRFERPDDDWLVVRIEVAAGGFRGTTDAHILTSELVRFASELQPLYDTLSGVAKFETLEAQLALRLSGDGKGHIHLEGDVRDQPGRGNCLKFELGFDQSQLLQSIKELNALLSSCETRAI